MLAKPQATIASAADEHHQSLPANNRYIFSKEVLDKKGIATGQSFWQNGILFREVINYYFETNI